MGLGYVLGEYDRWGKRPIDAWIGFIGGSQPGSRRLLGKEEQDRLVEILWENELHLVYCGMAGGLAGDIVRRIAGRTPRRVRALLVEGQPDADVPQRVAKETVDSHFTRMKRISEIAEAVVFLPGGLGTLSELTGFMAVRAAGLACPPLFVLDPDGWFDPIFDFLRTAARRRVVPGGTLRTVKVVSSVDSLERVLRRALL